MGLFFYESLRSTTGSLLPFFLFNSKLFFPHYCYDSKKETEVKQEMFNWFAGLTGFVLENEMLTVHRAGFFCAEFSDSHGM